MFYGYDYDGYFYDCFVSTEPTMERTILVKSGQGKEFVDPVLDITFFDEDGLANYKAVINKENEVEMIEIDTEEKTATKSKLLLNEFNRTLEEKILRLSQSCGNYINNGVDYNNRHFSYTLADQNNLKNAIELAKITKMDAPYHANGDSCDIYSLDDLVNIYVLNQTNLTHHITYFNQLKLYTEKLLTKEEIDNVQYGQSLTGEYLDKYNMIMKQSKKIISTYLGVEESIVDEILGLSTTISGVL